jgi:hypothetical protein
VRWRGRRRGRRSEVEEVAAFLFESMMISSGDSPWFSFTGWLEGWIELDWAGLGWDGLLVHACAMVLSVLVCPFL